MRSEFLFSQPDWFIFQEFFTINTNDVILVFQASLVETSDVEKDRNILCIVPFLLHIGVTQIDLLLPVIGPILKQSNFNNIL